MLKSRYPKIHILSKNELAKHISHEKFPPKEALALVNDVKENFDKYWKDSKSSQPDKNKYVRNASRTPLGILLKKINTQVLAPHDNLIPGFIFGGVKKMNHKAAAQNLLGNKRQRTILKMDISTFFERIKRERVFHFFYTKCQCSMSAANLLADFCCVPLGAKSAPSKDKSIGRGFATSSRLAVWCNLDTFIKIQRLVNKELKNNDPRISVYVDDIGITASRVTKQKMEDYFS
jgi:hypothetical protein